MISRLVISLLAAAALPLSAEQDRDRPLEEMEAKLQEQRALAVRARLALYSDELEKLQAQFPAVSDVSAVKTEMDAVQAAMRQLSAIARRQAEPAAADEVQKDEEISAATLAARRINRIIERFNAAKAPVRSPGGTVAAGSRVQTLKFEKSSRSRDYADESSRTYWGRENASAVWSLPNLPPGEYEIIFRFSSDPDTGGKAILKAGTAKLEVAVPRGVKGSTREQRLSAGTITVKEQGVDLRVENGGLAGKAESLWNLDAVIVQPAVKRP